jgi:ADP-heptose:LPS heptosyltransferase
MAEAAPGHVVLSRTDSIGDVMLTLPMAGLMKRLWPGVRITFLGRSYTRPVLACCHHVDRVLTLEELQRNDPPSVLRSLGADVLVHVFPQRQVAAWAKAAGIPVRIGTAHRWWHWSTCTHKVAFSRRRSGLHEAQLNLKLLQPLGYAASPPLGELAGLTGFVPPGADADVGALLHAEKRHVVLHPGSGGSAAEWGTDRFAELIARLDPARWQAILTGTAAEAEAYRSALPMHLPHVTDTGGRLSLEELIALIARCDALVAASTGPLHIAAACGIRAIGLYSPARPIHPGRWGPIGRDAHALVATPRSTGQPAADLRSITPDRVLDLLAEL